MKKLKMLLPAALLLTASLFWIAADHTDAPGVTGNTTDIADYYAFQSPNNDANLVFVATIQGLLAPAATGAASFDENVLIEFNIDKDGDLVEDMVIQAIPREGKMVFFGPVDKPTPGTSSTILTTGTRTEVDITEYGQDAVTATENGITVFAGPRDDPFFFDLGAYGAILGGTATGFSNPGTDTFAGTNVLAVVVEVPKSLIGASGDIQTWVSTKSK